VEKACKQFFPAAPALSLDGDLNQAAYKHLLNMYHHQFLEHTSSNGYTLAKCIERVNYSWRSIVENIAYNQKTTGQVIDA
jgi:uncharacterized protein YkwD